MSSERSQRTKGNRGRSLLPWLMVCGVVAVAIAAVLLVRQNDEGESSPPDMAHLRGVPIVGAASITNANGSGNGGGGAGRVSNRFGIAPGAMTNVNELAKTNAALAAIVEEPAGDKPNRRSRRRSKPGSYPKRLMDLQSTWLEEGKDPRVIGQDTLPDDYASTNLVPARVEGYLPVSFDQLSGFPLDLDPAVISNPDAGDPMTRVPVSVKELDGRRVALSGFLLPLRMDDGLAVEFLLMRDQTLCCFGGVPQINEWVNVRAAGEGAKPDMDVPITVCGEFTVSAEREEGTLISLYQMKAVKILPY